MQDFEIGSEATIFNGFTPKAVFFGIVTRTSDTSVWVKYTDRIGREQTNRFRRYKAGYARESLASNRTLHLRQPNHEINQAPWFGL